MDRSPRLLTPLLAAALPLACGAPRSTPAPDLELPSAWDTAAPDPGEAPSPWIASFGDEALVALVAEGLEHNRDVRAALARLEIAAAEARAAGSELSPSVNLAASGQRQKQNFVGLGDAFGVPGGGVPSATYDTFGVSLDVSWEADLWGRVRDSASAADAELAAEAALFDASRLSLAAQIAKAWFALGEARLQLELSERSVETYRANTEVARERLRVGLRSALDLELARAEESTARGLLARRAAVLDRARRQVELLLGRYPEGELAALEDLPAVPPPVPAGLPAELLGRRPDLAALSSRAAAAELRASAAEAALWPQLRLTASGGTATASLSDLTDGDFSVWSLGAGVLQPVFQGGRLRARVEASDAAARAALEAWAGGVLTACFEVETALAVESSLAEQEERARVAADAARAAADIAEEQYGAGIADIVTLLTAQRRALDAEGAWIAARRARLDTRVDLHLALGGDFASPEE